MSTYQVSWSQVRDFANTRSKSIQYIDLNSTYYINVSDGTFTLECSIDKDGGAECLEFEGTYKALANVTIDSRDDQGAVIHRFKAAKKGWVYSLLPIEFVTSTLGSLVTTKYDNTTRSIATLKLYDNNNTLITDPAAVSGCVKTVVDFEPTFDYEIVSGFAIQKIQPNSDLRLWVVAVPDVPEVAGGSREMLGGFNLAYLPVRTRIETDGRASKYMAYNATYHTNKLRIILRHDAGVAQDLLIGFEIFIA